MPRLICEVRLPVCRCRVKLYLPCSLIGILPRINIAEACLGSELHRESSAFALRIAPAILKIWGICGAFALCIAAEGRYYRWIPPPVMVVGCQRYTKPVYSPRAVD